jgi:hypothetical protein
LPGCLFCVRTRSWAGGPPHALQAIQVASVCVVCPGKGIEREPYTRAFGPPPAASIKFCCIRTQKQSRSRPFVSSPSCCCCGTTSTIPKNVGTYTTLSTRGRDAGWGRLNEPHKYLAGGSRKAEYIIPVLSPRRNSRPSTRGRSSSSSSRSRRSNNRLLHTTNRHLCSHCYAHQKIPPTKPPHPTHRNHAIEHIVTL